MVEIDEVAARPVVENLSFIGRIDPSREAVLSFEVSGIVTAIYVEEGDSVEAGDVVAQIDQRDYQSVVAQADADVSAAKAKLDLLLAGTRSEEIEAARANYSQAKIEEDYWRSESRRAAELFERGSGSESERNQAERSRLAATEAMRTAKALFDLAVAGPRKEEVAAARAELRAREETRFLAKSRLEKTRLKAPFPGTVEKRLIDPGIFVETAPAGSKSVMHLVDLGSVDAVVSVPEVALKFVSRDSEVRISSVTDETISASGRIVAVANVAHPGSGTYDMRIRIANREVGFRGGMIVSATLQSGSATHVIRVPLNAVRRPFGQPPLVFLLDPEESRVLTRRVRLGRIHGDDIEIVSGLVGGELLVVAGQHMVIEGESVAFRRQSVLAKTPGRP